MKNIGIVGLGLIGGSMAKAIKARTDCKVYGCDINEETMVQAKACGAIDGELTELSQLDLLVVALFPQAALDYVKEHCGEMKQGSIICDICGVKELICKELAPLCREQGVEFIGCHPMAGREKWGFANSDADLFRKASMILSPEGAHGERVVELQNFWKAIGFGRTVVTTAANHDRMIGYTSQLAHVLSNAYVKNPSALDFSGYTGGSFQDLTRVAKLNPFMWSELFFCNRDNLLRDTRQLIRDLEQYCVALENKDEEMMTALLKEGSDRKEMLLEQKGND